MMNFYIYLGAAFVCGFLFAWLIRTLSVAKIKKENRSLRGLLESERLMKETTQKENTFLLRTTDSVNAINDRLNKAEELIKIMDSDILLLQKSNEETETILANSEPALYDMKMKLIEANNTIARIKSQSPANLIPVK